MSSRMVSHGESVTVRELTSDRDRCDSCIHATARTEIFFEQSKTSVNLCSGCLDECAWVINLHRDREVFRE